MVRQDHDRLDTKRLVHFDSAFVSYTRVGGFHFEIRELPPMRRMDLKHREEMGHIAMWICQPVGFACLGYAVILLRNYF
ncbi:MAG TPA: hypothetical protein VHH94_00060 [Gammaproteobacteria bacterium]|nr:hypothetical protein [Gammaproteobacteria bacterium]